MKLALLYVSNVETSAIRHIFLVTHDMSIDFQKLCMDKFKVLNPKQTFVLEIWEGGKKLEEWVWSRKHQALEKIIEEESSGPTHWVQKDGESLIIYYKNPLESCGSPHNELSVIYAVRDRTIVNSYRYNALNKRWFGLKE